MDKLQPPLDGTFVMTYFNMYVLLHMPCVTCHKANLLKVCHPLLSAPLTPRSVPYTQCASAGRRRKSRRLFFQADDLLAADDNEKNPHKMSPAASAVCADDTAAAHRARETRLKVRPKNIRCL